MTGCAVGFDIDNTTAPCPQEAAAEIRVRLPGQDWSPWLPACQFHGDAIRGSLDADCSCGECPAGVELRPMSAGPVGLVCPGCGEPPMLLMGGGTQAFCQTDDCPWFTWDPTKTLAELNSDVKVIDLTPDNPTPDTP